MDKKVLIDKFWDGKTSEQEEITIKEFLKDSDFKNENPDLAAYFDFANKPKNKADDEFIDKLLKIPTLVENNNQQKKKFNFTIAASVIMVISIMAIQNYYNKQEEKEAQLQYVLLKEKLSLISNNLSKYQLATTELTQFKTNTNKKINP